MNAIVEPGWPKLAHEWCQALNAWMLTRPNGLCQLRNRTLQFEWQTLVRCTSTMHATFECQGYRWIVGLESLRVFDERLVGEPFMSMSTFLRTLTVEKLLSEILEQLPADIARNIDVAAITWEAPHFPDSWLELPFILRNTVQHTISHGVFLIEQPEGLNWLNQHLPAPENTKNLLSRALLRQRLPVNIGSTSLSIQQIQQLEAGDVVWIETAKIERQGLQAWLKLHAGQTTNVYRGHLKQRRLILSDPSLSKQHIGETAFPLTTTSNSAMEIDIAKVELPVTFDLGEITLSLAELERLGEQHIIELPQEAADARVNLRVHGTCMAQGRLMVVGRRLAVRLEKVGMIDVTAADGQH